jgi:hypothetical protein
VELKLSDNASKHTGTLHCPACGDFYLHHARVDVFSRSGEDSPTGMHVVVDDAGVAIDHGTSYEDGNPSMRRDGLAIYLTCENCPAVSVLTLVQHKGNTILDIKEVDSEPF